MTKSDVHFERPPVREMNLTLWFEPIHTLAALHLSPLRLAWEADLPKVEEKVPLTPWGPSEPISFNSDKWPMPACIFASPGRDKKVLVQNDRFSLTWYFTEKNVYPGFADLYGDYEEKYLQFVDTMAESENPDPNVIRATIEYENYLPHFDSHLLATSLMQSRSIGEDSLGTSAEGTTAAARIRMSSAEETRGVELLLGVDPSSLLEIERDNLEHDKRSGRGGPASLLTISGRTDVRKEDDPLSKLKIVHDVAINKFLSLFGDDVRKSWGEYRA